METGLPAWVYLFWGAVIVVIIICCVLLFLWGVIAIGESADVQITKILEGKK